MNKIFIFGLSGVLLITLGSALETGLFGRICSNLGALLVVIWLILFLIDHVKKNK